MFKLVLLSITLLSSGCASHYQTLTVKNEMSSYCKETATSYNEYRDACLDLEINAAHGVVNLQDTLTSSSPLYALIDISSGTFSDRKEEISAAFDNQLLLINECRRIQMEIKSHFSKDCSE